MSREAFDHMNNIVEAARAVAEFVAGMSFEEFAADKRIHYATTHAFEVIGESAGRIPQATRTECPGAPWAEMDAVRQALAEDYFDIDLRALWDAAHDWVPGVVEQAPQLLHADRAGDSAPKSVDSTALEKGALGEVVGALRERLPRVKECYGDRSLGVFGSYVRNEQTEDSDLDLLVDFDEAPSLFELLALENELSEAVGASVDLVMTGALKRRIGERISQEVVYL